MIDKQISSREVDFLLYIARFQDDFGKVYSVSYKDVCDSIHISIQKFYDILGSLASKGLIRVDKLNKADYCVTLVDNDFSDKDFSEGYLNVASQKFQSEDFLSLKAGSKLLYLYMQRFTKGRHMLLEKFYNEFCKRFHCAKKTIQEWLRQLNKVFLLISKRKRNRTYHYEMCMKIGGGIQLSRNEKIRLQTENTFYKSNIKQLIKRNFKRFLPEHPDRLLDDISELAITRFSSEIIGVPIRLLAAVRRSLLIQHEESKVKPVLNAALVNKCLTDCMP